MKTLQNKFWMKIISDPGSLLKAILSLSSVEASFEVALSFPFYTNYLFHDDCNFSNHSVFKAIRTHIFHSFFWLPSFKFSSVTDFPSSVLFFPKTQKRHQLLQLVLQYSLDLHIVKIWIYYLIPSCTRRKKIDCHFPSLFKSVGSVLFHLHIPRKVQIVLELFCRENQLRTA